MNKLGIAVIIGVSAISAAVVAEQQRIAFPENYTKEFTNYLSLDRVQNDDQIIRLFANKTALQAAREGRELPNGSILVGEVYKAKMDESGNAVVSSLGRRIRDKLAAIAVMQKGAGWGNKFPEELRNGDWDFAIFSPEGQPLDKDLNTCRQCHAPIKDKQHVFSLEHLGQ